MHRKDIEYTVPTPATRGKNTRQSAYLHAHPDCPRIVTIAGEYNLRAFAKSETLFGYSVTVMFGPMKGESRYFGVEHHGSWQGARRELRNFVTMVANGIMEAEPC